MRRRHEEMYLYEWSVLAWTNSRTRLELDAAGRGIFRELLDCCYTQGKIPKDPALLCQIAGANPEQFERSWKFISRHFLQDKKDPSSLRNKRADADRSGYFRYCKEQKQRRVDAIKKRELAKSNNNNELGNGGYNANQPKTETRQDETELEAETETRQDRKREGAQAVVVMTLTGWAKDPQFVAFCQKYKETGATITKADCAKAYFTWPKLEPDQKAAAHFRLAEYASIGQDPARVKRIYNFVEDREWERELENRSRGAPAPKTSAAAQRMANLKAKYEAEEAQVP